MKKYLKALALLTIMLFLSTESFSNEMLPEVGIHCKRYKTGNSLTIEASGGAYGFWETIFVWFSGKATKTMVEYAVTCDNGYEDHFYL
jgi:hypothetical protein